MPYTDEMIAKAKADLKAQIDPDSRARARTADSATRRRRSCKFDGGARGRADRARCLIAYLQILGQMVDFTTFDAAGPNLR